MHVVVIGGSGLIGARLVDVLRARGHDARSASRASGVDVTTGKGLPDALLGADTVVDVADTRSLDGQAPLAFFRTSAQNLAKAEEAAGVGHHVGLSIVGVDRLHSGYFAGKAAQENIVREARVPHTIIRSTQFFELIERMLESVLGQGLVRLPPALMQPIQSDDVAETLADLVDASALNATIEIAGPEQLPLSEVARLMLSANQDPRQVIPDASATFFGAALSYQSLIPGPDARVAHSTFAEWLRGRIAAD